MEYVITFKNTSIAIKAEKRLLEKAINAGVLPLPSQISAGCGICLRVSPDEIKSALEALTNIDEIGLYTRVMENGRFSYSELQDWRSLWSES